MTTAAAVAAAATFVWLGMVLAISFIEAPLKFRAPGITVPLGLGIGRLVFRALNVCELVLAAAVAVSIISEPPSRTATLALDVAILLLLAQVVAVRPRLTRRSDAVLAAASPQTVGAGPGGSPEGSVVDPGAAPDAHTPEAPRDRSHIAYVVLEVLKVAALLVGGISLLTN